MISPAFGENSALFKNLDRTRYVALAKQYSGLAKDPGVTRTDFGGIHDDQQAL